MLPIAVLGIGAIVAYIFIIKALWFKKEDISYGNQRNSIFKRIIKIVIMIVSFILLICFLTKVTGYITDGTFLNYIKRFPNPFMMDYGITNW